MSYKKLTPADWVWLRKFNTVFSGRASKALCDELGVSEATRKELYNARTPCRADAFQRSVPLCAKKEKKHAASPETALIEIADKKKSLKNFPT